jgi:energy-coupling factor transporter ATP-binding protein EcfA2
MLARLNPFNTSKIRLIPYQWREATPSQLLFSLEQNRFRGSILGPHGSGKSTLLQTLRSLLEKKGFKTVQIFLNRDSSIHTLELFRHVIFAHRTSSVLFIDGADLLSWPQWMMVRWFAFSLSGVIVTSHEQPLLPVIWRCRPERGLAQDIVRFLSGTTVPEVAIQQLFLKHSGNMREILRELYDEYSSLEN